jgi:hypothetical protein
MYWAAFTVADIFKENLKNIQELNEHTPNYELNEKR